MVHIFTRKETCQQLSLKITAGILHDQIVTDHQFGDKQSNNSKLNLPSVINQHDLLHATTASILSNTVALSEDLSATNAFIREMGDSVLYYKQQGVPGLGIGEKLDIQDFVIIIMNSLQEKMLRKYGQDVVTLDGTHGTNSYGYALHTLLVIDEFREGFATAIAMSNRNDQTVINIFLSCIKEKVGTLHIRVLMSDMPETYYNSWCRIMNEPERWFLNPWHVHERWRLECNSVTDVVERKKLLLELYDLSSTINEEYFWQKLKDFVNSNDKKRAKFLVYFRAHYANCTETWAYCYRMREGVDTNVYCKTAYKKFKQQFMKNEKMSEMWKGLNYLETFLKQQLSEAMLKELKGKVSRKLKILRRRHDKLERQTVESDVSMHSETQWFVSVTETVTGQNEPLVTEERIYLVEKLKNTCSDCELFCEKCQICFHEYACHCVDASIKNNMCEHIHALGRYLRFSGHSVITSPRYSESLSDPIGNLPTSPVCIASLLTSSNTIANLLASPDSSPRLPVFYDTTRSLPSSSGIVTSLPTFFNTNVDSLPLQQKKCS